MMAERPFQLTLNREQQSILFAQILTYMFSLTYRPTVPPPKKTIEQLQEVAYDLRPWSEKPQVSLVLFFSPETVRAIKSMIDTLQMIYEKWIQHDDSPAALQDLMMCRTLIEDAEQQANAGTEGR